MVTETFTNQVYLGTMVLERNRWGVLEDAKFTHLQPLVRCRAVVPTVRISDWLDRAAGDGFDGVELFEPHAFFASDAEVAHLAEHDMPIEVFNSYFGLDDDDAIWRDAVAKMAHRLDAGGVKYNFGKDAGRLDQQLHTLRRFADACPDHTRIICECHSGNITDDPATLETIAGRLDDDRFHFTVHLMDEPDNLRKRFAALGERITHCHVWRKPEIDDDALRERVDLVGELGFVGSYTIEFTRGIGWGRPDPPTETLYDEAVDDMQAVREQLSNHKARS
jgi:sugar phosphate isomerase/epimerase